MSERRIIRAVIVGLLVLPGLVAGSAFASCSHQDPAPHQCCATSAPEHGEAHGCCSGEALRLQTAAAGNDCSCTHTPETPASPAASSSQALQKDGSPYELLPATPAVTPVETSWVTLSSPYRGPPPGHAPLFLLDCSLLI